MFNVLLAGNRLVLLFSCFHLFSITIEGQPVESEWRNRFNPDTSQTSVHHLVLNKQKIAYQATVGTLPVCNAEGKNLGGLFYAYYRRSDTYSPHRPIIFLFNGGPGSASIYLHMGGFGSPVIANLEDSGLPKLPYGLKTNEYSVLDIADLVYIDPLETGYSKLLSLPVPGDERFFNVQGDIDYLSDWIRLFLTRYNRWLSPKYLVGESYASIRVAGLSKSLQDKWGIYVNGVVLVSSVLPLENNIDALINSWLRIPQYSAIAWDKGLLDSVSLSQPKTKIINKSKIFVCEELVPAIFGSQTLDHNKRQYLAKKISELTTVPSDQLMYQKLIIDSAAFKENVAFNGILQEPGGYSFTDLFMLSQIQYYSNGLAKTCDLHKNNELVEELVSGSLLTFQCKDILGLPITDEEISKVYNELVLISGALFEDTLAFRRITKAGRCVDSILTQLKQKFSEHQSLVTNKEYLISQTWPAGGVYDQSFSAAFHAYLDSALHYYCEFPYILTNLTTRPWSGDRLAVNGELISAMEKNPFLQVMFQTGYQDGAPIEKSFQKRSLDHTAIFKTRIHSKVYQSGHVMYIDKKVRKLINQDLRNFITESQKINWN